MEGKVAVIHLTEEKAVLCVPPAKPFLKVPAYVAKDGYNNIYVADDAASLKESNDPSYVKAVSFVFPAGIRYSLFNAFFEFVLSLPIVKARFRECQYLVACSSYASSLNRTYFERFPATFLRQYIDIPTCRFFSDEFLGVNGCHLNEQNGNNFMALNVTDEFSHLCVPNSRVICYGRKFDIGIDAIVSFFVKLLCEKGYSLTSTAERKFCKDLVKKYCYVAVDVEAELLALEAKGGVIAQINIGDGSTIELGKEAFMAPEILFNPSLIGVDTDGIVSVYNHYCIGRTGMVPIVLVGNFVKNLKGFRQRFQKECAVDSIEFKVGDVYNATLIQSLYDS
mmetsp:Transcript_5528/g.6418  ORF Transcript_5528/g.6418 Transcript_5528/m.6418 type:complete len:337 (-) Transcript_5528:245-1255(-)